MLGDAKGATWPNDKDGYFKKIGWIHAPAAGEGRRAQEPLAPDRLRGEPEVGERGARGACSWPTPPCPTTTPSTP